MSGAITRAFGVSSRAWHALLGDVVGDHALEEVLRVRAAHTDIRARPKGDTVHVASVGSVALFRSRAEKKVVDAGYDPARLPPGQYITDKWPVLHAGSVPETDLATWDFRVWGQVEREAALSWDELNELPKVEVTQDIHCVTRWSRFDVDVRGRLLERARRARHADADRAIRDRPRRAGLHGQHAAVVPRGSARGLRHACRRRAADAGARRPAPSRRARQVFLEEREVAARDRARCPPTSPASGSATATTTTPIPGRKSATSSEVHEKGPPVGGPSAIERMGRWARTRGGDRAPPRTPFFRSRVYTWIGDSKGIDEQRLL